MSYSATPQNLRISHHASDGNTVAHWLLDGDLTDSVGGYDMVSGSYDAMPLDPIGKINAHLQGSTDTYVTQATAAALQLLGAVSAAALMYLRAVPAENIPIIACSPIGGGAGSSNNIPYTLEITATGVLQYQQQWGSKTTHTYASALTVPLNEWCWVAFTRDSAGTGVTLALNTDTATTTAASAPTGGANADVAIGTKWNGANLDAVFASAIIKDIEVTDLAAWRAQTGLR